jgi:hypothetical protein
MNQKIQITKSVAEQLQLSTDNKSIKKLLHLWWQNPRKKEKGGLKLTKQGFADLNKADIKNHRIKFEEPIEIYENQLIIHLDRFIDCPWFIIRDSIYVFNDRTAVQLILFSGNVKNFITAKLKSIKSA